MPANNSLGMDKAALDGCLWPQLADRTCTPPAQTHFLSHIPLL